MNLKCHQFEIIKLSFHIFIFSYLQDFTQKAFQQHIQSSLLKFIFLDTPDFINFGTEENLDFKKNFLYFYSSAEMEEEKDIAVMAINLKSS